MSEKNTTSNAANNGEKISIEKEFELREKRIKIVYKILYVVAAVWGISFLSLITSETKVESAPIYALVLSVCTLYIINILKYALNELACMRIHNDATEFEKRTAEFSYTNIWKKSSLPLLIGTTTMLFHIMNEDTYSSTYFSNVFMVTAILCGISTMTKLFLSITKKEKAIEHIGWIDPIISEIMAYSIFAMCCLMVTK